MILHVRDLHKSFQTPDRQGTINILRGINLTMTQGQTVAVLGQSGSGKSTLLSLLAGLDKPSSGAIELDGKRLDTLSEQNLAEFRARNISIVFQQFHLLPHLSALENVGLPLELEGAIDAGARAEYALHQVGLQDRLSHFPSQLSGGECQRVAIARAMATRPLLLLADEPTGNLDPKTGQGVACQLFDLIESTGMTMLMVTHDESMVQRCQRSLVLEEGILHERVD